jgi:hypothetical protein
VLGPVNKSSARKILVKIVETNIKFCTDTVHISHAHTIHEYLKSRSDRTAGGLPEPAAAPRTGHIAASSTRDSVVYPAAPTTCRTGYVVATVI